MTVQLLSWSVSPLSVEWFFPVRRFVLTKLTSSSFSMECVCCVQIWHNISLPPQSTCVHTLRTLPLRRFHPFRLLRTSQLPFDYSRNTVRRFHGYHSRDSADAFDDSDCADALKQIHRYPLTTPRKSCENTAETPGRFRRWSAEIHVANPRIL